MSEIKFSLDVIGTDSKLKLKFNGQGFEVVNGTELTTGSTISPSSLHDTIQAILALEGFQEYYKERAVSCKLRIQDQLDRLELTSFQNPDRLSIVVVSSNSKPGIDIYSATQSGIYDSEALANFLETLSRQDLTEKTIWQLIDPFLLEK